jgi:hypothetical protein
MSSDEIKCGKCGTVARLVSHEGEVFPTQPTERPMLFHVIDCPCCGHREQPDGHNGHGGAIGPVTGS